MSLEAFFEIVLDSGTLRFAMGDFSSDLGFYPGRLLSIAGMSRDVSPTPDEFRPASWDVELSDPDNYFGALKAAEPFHNRAASIYLGDPDAGIADFTVIATGNVVAWSKVGDVFAIAVADPALKKFDQPVYPNYAVTIQNFVNLPDGTKREKVAVAFGDVSAPRGAVPGYLIEDEVTASTWRYALMADVTFRATLATLFVYGVAKTEGVDFTTSVVNYNGQDYLVADFTSDQRDAARTNENEVTFNTTTTNVDNRTGAWIMRHLLDQHGFDNLVSPETSLDVTAFDAAVAYQLDRNITIGVVLNEKDESLETAVARLARSLNMTLAFNLTGQAQMVIHDGTPTSSAGLVTIAEGQIIEESFEVNGPEDFASRVDYNFSRDWNLKEFQGRLSNDDAAEETNLGEAIRREVNLDFVYGPSAAGAIVNDLMFFLKEKRQIVSFLADPALIKSIKLGDDVVLTHFGGLGADGYGAELFRVLSHRIEVTPESITLGLTLIDLTSQDFSVSTEFLQFATDQSEPVWWTDAPPPRERPRHRGGPAIPR